MKKFWKSLTIVVAAILLTGCMKMNVKVVIEDENTATMSMEAYYSKEMLDSYGADPDEAFEQFNSGKYEGWQTKDISKTIDGKEYVGVELTAPAKECKDILDNLTVKEEGKSKVYTFTMSSNNLDDLGDPDDLEGTGYSLDQMKKLGLEMVMSIQMPGKIKNATFGKIDGDTVTIDLLEMAMANASDIKIVAEESTSANSMYLYLAGGVAVLAVIAVVVIVMKKKKATPINSTTDNETSIPEPVQTENTAIKEEVVENETAPEVDTPIEETSQPTDESEENKE